MIPVLIYTIASAIIRQGHFILMETKRLIIKNYEENNYEDFVKLFTDSLVMKYVGDGVLTTAEAKLLWKKLFEEFYSKGLNTIYAVFVKEDFRYIGQCWIRPRPKKKSEWELGYVLKSSEWGKGWATEISKRLLEFGFNELNLNTVYATIDVENIASIKVAEKSGMRKISDDYDEKGKFYVYGKDRDNFARA